MSAPISASMRPQHVCAPPCVKGPPPPLPLSKNNMVTCISNGTVVRSFDDGVSSEKKTAYFVCGMCGVISEKPLRGHCDLKADIDRDCRTPSTGLAAARTCSCAMSVACVAMGGGSCSSRPLLVACLPRDGEGAIGVMGGPIGTEIQTAWWRPYSGQCGRRWQRTGKHVSTQRLFHVCCSDAVETDAVPL